MALNDTEITRRMALQDLASLPVQVQPAMLLEALALPITTAENAAAELAVLQVAELTAVQSSAAGASGLSKAEAAAVRELQEEGYSLGVLTAALSLNKAQAQSISKAQADSKQEA